MEDVPLEAISEHELWDLLPERDGSDKSDILMELHRRHGHRGDHLQAAGFAEQAAAESVAVDNLSRAAVCKFAQGRALAAGDQLDGALECFLAAAELDGKTGDQSEIAADLRAAGDICARLERHAEAIAHLRNAESLYVVEEQNEQAGKVAMQIAQIMYSNDEIEECIPELDRARDLLRQAHDIEGVALVDDFKAGALLDLDQVDQAVELLRDCLRVAESTKGEKDDAYARHRLASALWDKGEPAEALHHLERAREQYMEQELAVAVAACDRLAASCLRALGELDRAEELFRSARAVYDAAGFDAEALRCDVEIAILEHSEARFSEAAAMNSRIAQSGIDLESPQTTYNAISRWADNLLAAGSFAECISLLDEHSNDSDDEVMEGAKLWRLSIRAQALFNLGRNQEAIAAAEAGISLLPEEIAAYGKAACYEVRGLALIETEPRQGERDLGHAIALYLGAGSDDKARALSRHFMPESPMQTVVQPSELGSDTPIKPTHDSNPGTYL